MKAYVAATIVCKSNQKGVDLVGKILTCEGVENSLRQ